MEIERELAKLVPQRETLLTVGVFDGVHAGHCYLIQKLTQRAKEKDLISGVVTFDPHPQWVLHPHNQLPWLSNLEDRVNRLQELGVSLIAILSFTPELASLSAREFVTLLKRYLKMHGLVIGPDFALGRGREGDSTVLSALGREVGFSVETVPPSTVDGEVVSSTLIRQALAQGDMTKVTKLMGHNFYLAGKVISADKRGRSLGFPTANLNIKQEQALPGNGVYTTIAWVNGKQFASATNIGTRPTFGGSGKVVETHLLNYEGDLYGEELKVEFVQKLRNEQRFASPRELKEQIGKDIQEAEMSLRAKRGNLRKQNV